MKIPEYFEWDENRVYVMMALTRAAENDGMTANSRRCRRLVVREREDWDRCVDELTHWCGGDDLTYRLYVSVNARNVQKATFQLRERTDEFIKMKLNGHEGVNKKFKKLDSEFKSILQWPQCKAESYDLYDIDGWTTTEVDEFLSEYDNLKVLHRRETPNGHHVITEPSLMQERDGLEIKKDAMLHLTKL